MAVLDPSATTVGDICTQALKDSGAIGVGQTPTAEDVTDAWTRLQWMLQEWQRRRWLVYHNIEVSIVSTGARRYSIGGAGADINLAGDFGPDFDITLPAPPDFLGPLVAPGGGSQRPDKIESAWLRQLTQSTPNQIDYPLEILHSHEDYGRIALKGLVSFPGVIFYDPGIPFGYLYPWPIPQAAIYAIFIVIKEQLPTSFKTLATKFALPYEYYLAMTTNLAMRLRPKYGIGTYPGDQLPAIAKAALDSLRGANTAIAALTSDPASIRGGIYNIFSDRFY
jgi:hypothetical protein